MFGVMPPHQVIDVEAKADIVVGHAFGAWVRLLELSLVHAKDAWQTGGAESNQFEISAGLSSQPCRDDSAKAGNMDAPSRHCSMFG
eukprot:1140752-Pelagomonas_calceolata.AAC.3